MQETDITASQITAFGVALQRGMEIVLSLLRLFKVTCSLAGRLDPDFSDLVLVKLGTCFMVDNSNVDTLTGREATPDKATRVFGRSSLLNDSVQLEFGLVNRQALFSSGANKNSVLSQTVRWKHGGLGETIGAKGFDKGINGILGDWLCSINNMTDTGKIQGTGRCRGLEFPSRQFEGKIRGLQVCCLVLGDCFDPYLRPL